MARDGVHTTTLPEPDAVYDAGSLGCGDGPLPIIAATLREMAPASVLEIRSTDPGVAADLPAWCRMTGHKFLGGGSGEDEGRYFVQRKSS
jgi:TusA-related sulfurtransferase